VSWSNGDEMTIVNETLTVAANEADLPVLMLSMSAGASSLVVLTELVLPTGGKAGPTLAFVYYKKGRLVHGAGGITHAHQARGTILLRSGPQEPQSIVLSLRRRLEESVIQPHLSTGTRRSAIEVTLPTVLPLIPMHITITPFKRKGTWLGIPPPTPQRAFLLMADKQTMTMLTILKTSSISAV